jgi:hypothetical protein
MLRYKAERLEKAGEAGRPKSGTIWVVFKIREISLHYLGQNRTIGAAGSEFTRVKLYPSSFFTVKRRRMRRNERRMRRNERNLRLYREKTEEEK